MKPKLLYLLFFPLVLTGCMTYDYVPQNKVVTKKVADVSVTLTYMTQSELRKRHGSESNPFVDMPKGVFQRDLVVFLCEIETEETIIEIASPKIIMRMGDKTDKAKTVITYMLYWKGYVNDSIYNAMVDKCKQYLIPQNFTVRPGKKVQGYLVFFNNLPPEMGQAIISIPAVTEGGDAGIIEIPFFLDDPRAREAAAKKKKKGKELDGKPSIFKQEQPSSETGSDQTDDKPSIFGEEGTTPEDKPSIFDQDQSAGDVDANPPVSDQE